MASMTKKFADTINQLTQSKADWNIERRGDKTWIQTPQGRI